MDAKKHEGVAKVTCYACGSEVLVLAPLTKREREVYAKKRLVMRRCRDCQKVQIGDDEPMSPLVAAQEAPDA